MMNEFQSFLAMGGYAPYVWPAYAITIGAFAVIVIWSVRGLTARRREEKQLATLGRRTRNRSERQQ
jgi:heme exporter protein CcmD